MDISDNPTPLGLAFSEALFDLLTRFRLIKHNVLSFSRIIYWNDLNLSIRDVRIRKSILESIDDPEDSSLKEDLDQATKLLDELIENQTKFVEEHFNGSLELMPKPVTSNIGLRFRYSMGGLDFYFDPHILPSSQSKSSSHNPNYSLSTRFRG